MCDDFKGCSPEILNQYSKNSLFFLGYCVNFPRETKSFVNLGYLLQKFKFPQLVIDGYLEELKKLKENLENLLKLM